MAAAKTWRLPSTTAIAAILSERIDTQRDGVGIVTGVIDAGGSRIIAHGRTQQRGRTPVGADTVFEVGSITKVFTSLVLADMVLRGETTPDEPVRALLPLGAVTPSRGGREITLRDLATHRSGLPRLPSNFAPADPENPYVDYGPEQLLSFLAGHQLSRDVGERYEYSNLGAGLLGYALSLRAGCDYETLVSERITAPLGMHDTVITLTPPLRARLARGHNAQMRPVANWDMGVLAGAGALRSTARDMLKFLAAVLGLADTPICAAMRAQLAAARVATESPNLTVGLGWHVKKDDYGTATWHNGGTAGYRAFAGVDLVRGTGVVVLTNASSARGGDDIASHLLVGTPLAAPPPWRKRVRVPEAALQRYVGLYRYSPAVTIEISRAGASLFADVTNIGRAEIFPATSTTFYWSSGVKLTFDTNGTADAPALATQRPGQDPLRAVRESQSSRHA
jgi:D-alanyl-D-alanine-carboxypeptidase/D-alanyl-D-alanine-endopeptidase